MRIPILLSTLAVGLAVPASAQSLPDWAAPSGPPPTSSSVQSLPDWAAPSELPPPSAPSSAAVSGPDLPDDPTPVPLDGGLGLLALAGGAYAARRLRASS